MMYSCWPLRTYIQQLCADTGCSSEILPEAVDDREGRWKRVRNIRADSVTWGYIYIYIYICVCVCVCVCCFSEYVAVTIKKLFSLANQCPRQAIRPHTDQSADRVHWFHLPSKELFFSSLFLEITVDQQRVPDKQRIKTSLLSLSTGRSSIDDPHWR